MCNYCFMHIQIVTDVIKIVSDDFLSDDFWQKNLAFYHLKKYYASTINNPRNLHSCLLIKFIQSFPDIVKHYIKCNRCGWVKHPGSCRLSLDHEENSGNFYENSERRYPLR